MHEFKHAAEVGARLSLAIGIPAMLVPIWYEIGQTILRIIQHL